TRFTFGADSSPNDDLVEFARDTDLFLVEGTLPRPEREGPRGHLTPGEAGDHGRRANAKRLVVTHISDELDADWARIEAERAFGADVVVEQARAVYEDGILRVEIPLAAPDERVRSVPVRVPGREDPPGS